MNRYFDIKYNIKMLVSDTEDFARNVYHLAERIDDNSQKTMEVESEYFKSKLSDLSYSFENIESVLKTAEEYIKTKTDYAFDKSLVSEFCQTAEEWQNKNSYINRLLQDVEKAFEENEAGLYLDMEIYRCESEFCRQYRNTAGINISMVDALIDTQKMIKLAAEMKAVYAPPEFMRKSRSTDDSREYPLVYSEEDGE